MLHEYCQNYLLIPRTLPFPDVKDEGPGWADQVDLRGIATILDNPQFARLQKVVVDCWYWARNAPNPEWVSERRVDLLVEAAVSEQ